MLRGSPWAARRDRELASMEAKQRRIAEWRDDVDGRRTEWEHKRAQRRAEFAARIPVMVAKAASEVKAAVAADVSEAIAAPLEAAFARHNEAIRDAVINALNRPGASSSTTLDSSLSDLHAPAVALAVGAASICNDSELALAVPISCSTECPGGVMSATGASAAPSATTNGVPSACVVHEGGIHLAGSCLQPRDKPACTLPSPMVMPTTSQVLHSVALVDSNGSEVLLSMSAPLDKPEGDETAVMHEDELLLPCSSVERPLSLVTARDVMDDHSYITDTSAMPLTWATLDVDDDCIANKHEVLLPLKLLELSLSASKELFGYSFEVETIKTWMVKLLDLQPWPSWMNYLLVTVHHQPPPAKPPDTRNNIPAYTRVKVQWSMHIVDCFCSCNWLEHSAIMFEFKFSGQKVQYSSSVILMSEGAIHVGPEGFPWEIAWVLMETSCACSECGGHRHVTSKPWPPPPSILCSVPTQGKNPWFHHWLELLFSENDCSLTTWVGGHTTGACLMSKHMGLTVGKDTPYGVNKFEFMFSAQVRRCEPIHGFHHGKLWDPRCIHSRAWNCQWWKVLGNYNCRLGAVRSTKQWSPLKGMCGIRSLMTPQEGVDFYHISFALHATSSSWDHYLQNMAETRSLSCELLAIGNPSKWLLYVQSFLTMGLFSTKPRNYLLMLQLRLTIWWSDTQCVQPATAILDSYSPIPVNCQFARMHFILSRRAQINEEFNWGTSLDLVFYRGDPALALTYTSIWRLMIVGFLLQDGTVLLLLISGHHVCAVQGYRSSSMLLAILNGRAKVQQHCTCMRAVPVAVPLLNQQSALNHTIVWRNRIAWCDHSATATMVCSIQLLELFRSSDQDYNNPIGLGVHRLGHAFYFDKVCADQDYYIDVFCDQENIGHDHYLVRAICYLNLVKVCLDYNTYRDLGEVKKQQVPWDPGDLTWHRLEVKPNFKEGGMLGTNPPITWAGPWATGLGPHSRTGGIEYKYIGDAYEQIGLDRDGFGLLSLGRRLPLASRVPLFCL